MGCAPSAFDLAVQSNKTLKQNLTQYSLLQLSESDVRKLYNIYYGIDENGGDMVDLAELLAHIELSHSGFAAKILSAFDFNNSRTTDFNEFVLALWNACTLTKGILDIFAFELYDKSNSGELSSSQVLGMIEDLFGKNESKTNADIKLVIAELQDFERRKVVFSLDRFRNFVKKHEVILQPLVQTQQVLQTKTLGVGNWERITEKRMKLANGRYLPVAKFIALQGSGKPYTSLSTPGQSCDDDGHHQDAAFDAVNRANKHSAAIKTTALTTSFELDEGSSARMTNSTKLSSNGGLTDSAKVRWTASLQSLVTAVSAKHTRRSKTNRVHASPKSFSTTSTGSGGKNKSKSRNNSNSADADKTESIVTSTTTTTATTAAAATVTNAGAAITARTSSGVNLSPRNDFTPEPTARRRSVTFGVTADPPVSTAAAGNSRSNSPMSALGAHAQGASATKTTSPLTAVAGASASARAGAGADNGITSTVSPTAATSARGTSQRRGSRDIDPPTASVTIWSNEANKTSPKNSGGHSPKNFNSNKNQSNSNANHSHNHASGVSSTTAGSPHAVAHGAHGGGSANGGKEAPIIVFDGKSAFVPHDDAALAVRSRPAARRSVILPGAVEDAQELTEYMHLHQKCRSSD